MKNLKTTLALSTSLTAALLAGQAQAASENPFAAKSLEQGYQIAQADSMSNTGKAKDGMCGEGKCGSEKAAKKANKKMKEGSCGGKAKEGHCGGEAKATEGKCGGEKKASEGSCGGKK